VNRLFRKTIPFLTAAGILLLCAAVQAADYQTPWLEPPSQPIHTKWRKLGRGASNFFLGWTEIAFQPFRMGIEGDRWPIAALGGIPRGFFYGAGRTLVGAYEVAFFAFENPGGGYEPIIQPESPIPRKHLGWY